MTPPAAAATAATKPAPATKTPAAAPPPPAAEAKPAKASKKTSEVEKMNARVVAFATWVRENVGLFAGAIPVDPATPTDKKLAAMLGNASEAFVLAFEAAEKASGSLLALHKEKWTPPKPRRAGDWRVGDPVALKPKRVKRYVPAYEAADLASLVVVSAHGAMFKGPGLQGRPEGGRWSAPVPGSWLGRAEPKK